jgi:thioredoxin reductase
VITETTDVLVIGAGPAGLTAAAELSIGGTEAVLVLEREKQAGGIPRHSDHLGYGIRDLHRFLRGPEYAARLVEVAGRSGAMIRTQAMVTGWDEEGAAEVTSPEGRYRVKAKATILATGARERPRSARLIPGDRPPGIYTTGQIQNLVHLQNRQPGSRAVVVGAELVSWSAVMTLRHAGCRTVLMTTEHPTPESYAVFNRLGRLAYRVPVATSTRVVGIAGRGSLRHVEIEDKRTGARRTVDCDTIVFTGSWIPDHELARAMELQMDPGTLGPTVDGALRTSRPGVFAVGNLVHPVDTADVAALDGKHVARHVRSYLDGQALEPIGATIEPRPPFRWVAPNRLTPARSRPARDRLLLWSDEMVRQPRVSVRQDDREIGAARVPWPASPGRVFRIPASLLDRADPLGGPISIGIG